jgi:hypothetical protein
VWEVLWGQARRTLRMALLCLSSTRLSRPSRASSASRQPRSEAASSACGRAGRGGGDQALIASHFLGNPKHPKSNPAPPAPAVAVALGCAAVASDDDGRREAVPPTCLRSHACRSPSSLLAAFSRSVRMRDSEDRSCSSAVGAACLTRALALRAVQTTRMGHAAGGSRRVGGTCCCTDVNQAGAGIRADEVGGTCCILASSAAICSLSRSTSGEGGAGGGDAAPPDRPAAAGEAIKES